MTHISAPGLTADRRFGAMVPGNCHRGVSPQYWKASHCRAKRDSCVSSNQFAFCGSCALRDSPSWVPRRPAPSIPDPLWKQRQTFVRRIQSVREKTLSHSAQSHAGGELVHLAGPPFFEKDPRRETGRRVNGVAAPCGVFCFAFLWHPSLTAQENRDTVIHTNTITLYHKRRPPAPSYLPCDSAGGSSILL